jgi:hypothetical protein
MSPSRQNTVLHGKRCLALALALPALALLGPTRAAAAPVDKALDYGEAAGTRGAASAAASAAAMGSRRAPPGSRAVPAAAAAWISVGRLGVVSPELIAAAVAVVGEPAAAPVVRARAAWALGELGRVASPAEAAEISAGLQGLMVPGLELETAAALVEAFGKAYAPHAHSTDEDIAAARALTRLTASMKQSPPPAAAVVLDRLLSPEVTVRLLREVVAEARTRPSPQAQAELYLATLTTIRWMAARQSQLLASWSEQQTLTRAAFDALLSTLDPRDRELSLLLVWSMGYIASEPLFAELVGGRLSSQLSSPDPTVRLVASWSHYALRSGLAEREALRAHLLGLGSPGEADPRVLELMGALRGSAAELDPVQRLLGVEPAP